MHRTHTTAQEMNFSTSTQTRTLSHGDCEEFFIHAVLEKGESAEALFEKAVSCVRETGAQVISQEIIGLSEGGGVGRKLLESLFGQVNWPVTWIENGHGLEPLAGTQIWAVSGTAVERICLGDRTVGSVFENDDARYCRLGDAGPAVVLGSPEKQARKTLEGLETALQLAGMEFSNVLRTWFFNNDILSWYSGFNTVRNAFFAERGVFDGLVPASTGIGGRNANGSALTGGLLAVERKSEDLRVFAVPSPLQCPALEYGSSFSRAVEFQASAYRRLFVSGTASIEPGGETVHVGDVDKQIDTTMQVVAAILESRGMDWGDVIRGSAYVKHPEDAPAYSRYCAAKGLSDIPVTLTNNAICRDDLLFEIEVDAAQQI